MSSAPTSARRSRRAQLIDWLEQAPPPASAVMLVVATALMALAHKPNGLEIDTTVYRYGAQVFLGGTDRLYEQPYGALPFTYPPVAAVFFTPLAIFPDRLTAFLMIVVGILATWRLTWVVLDALRPRAPRSHASVAALVLPLAVLTEPLFDTFGYGQINLVLAWLIAEDLLGPGRRRLGGVLLGVATLIKLTPAIFVLILLLRRDVPSVLRYALTLASGVGVGYLLMPHSSATFWANLTQASDRVGDPAYYFNQSLKGALARAGLTSPAVWLAAVVLVLAVSTWAAWVALRADRQVPAVLAVAICGLMISPVSWGHHWVWLWPLLLWAFAGHDFRPGPLSTAVAAVWAAEIYSFGSFWALPHDHTWPTDAPLWQTILADLYVLLGAGTVVMFGWRAARLHRARRTQHRDVDPAGLVAASASQSAPVHSNAT